VYAGVIVGAFLVALGPIADGDIYWHLAAGREMVARHALLRADPFTTSAAGRPWIDVHWLFQLLAFWIFRVSGFVGLAVAKAAAVAATAAISTRTAERAGGPVARDVCAATLLTTLYLARHLLPLRPIIATALFLAVFLHALENRGQAPRRIPWHLPLLQVIWVNCQGLAPLGLLLVGAYLAEAALARVGSRVDDRGASLRPLLLTFALCVLASFVNPFGRAGVALPAHLLARIAPGQQNIFSTAIAENIPPFVLERTSPEQIGHFKWVLLAIALALVAFRPRLRLAHVVLLVAFLGLALVANRNVLLLYLMAPPLIAIGIGAAFGGAAPGIAAAPLPPIRARWLAHAAHLALAALVGVATLTFSREPATGQPTPFHFPVGSASRLAELGASGPVFAPDHAGGYLTFTVPGLRPYIDTRLMLHTAPEYAAYLALLDDPTGFDALAAAQGFRYVVLTTGYPDRYLRLAAQLAHDDEWKLIYTDGSELLYARGGAGAAAGDGLDLGRRETIDHIANELGGRFRGHPALENAARLNLARTLAVLGHARQALYLLGTVDTRAATQLRARAYFIDGDLAAAESLARVLLQDEQDRASLTLMAEIALARGRGEDARDWLRRALAIDPYDPEARAAMSRLDGAAPRRP